MHKLFPLLLMILLIGCQKKSPKQKTESTQILGLASPLQLQPDSTILVLGDYFLHPEKIDSLKFPVELRWQTHPDSAEIVVIKGNTQRAWSFFSAFSAGQRFDIPLKRSTKTKYTFTFDARGVAYQKVQVRGTFNAWNALANAFVVENGVYSTDLMIQPGSYEYLLVLDGRDELDPNNPQKVSNGQGGYNSVLRIVDETPDPYHVRTVAVSDTGFSLYLPYYQKDVQDLLVFWQNQLLAPIKTHADTIFYATPAEAIDYERTFIRAYTGNASKKGNDLLIPLHHRTVITDPADINRNDWEAAIMYFLMIDRFKNGNPENDSTVNDPDIHPKANYYGGDIAGVMQAIQRGFFDSLGTNTIWISPITQNPWDAWGLWDKGGVRTKFSGYHGYWPTSNVVPDQRFATEAELHQFLDLAHQHSNNVLLDYVANHVHELHPIYQKNKDWATNLYLPDGSLNTERWDDHRLTTWFDTFMPTLDLRRREIVEPMTDSALVWVEKYSFDGFRHDATKHIDELYWRVLTRKTKSRVMLPGQKRIYQIGETYGSPELISSYIGSGMLDAQFDFNMYDVLVGALVEKNMSFQRVADVLNTSLQWYGHHHLMGNISGNQDRVRFISYASGDVRFDEDGKLAGWTRNIPKPNATAYKKLALLHAVNFSLPGIPVIYYGDEYGSYGAGDPDNRKMMKFEGYNADETELINRVRELTHIRKNNLALTYGSTNIQVLNDDVIVIHRQYFDQHVWMIVNKSNREALISIDELEREKYGLEAVEEGSAGDLHMQMDDKGIYFVVKPFEFGVVVNSASL